MSMGYISNSKSSVSGLDQALGNINNNIIITNDNVLAASDTIRSAHDELLAVAKRLDEFVFYQMRQNRLAQARTELIKIRQELEKQFGHYDSVRRTTQGILQSNDIGIVRKNTIETATEELMIQTPGYWLAPCLVALSAWIADKKELADKALKEALHRDEKKTSLFFLLVCRRANRNIATLKWLDKYLNLQDAEAVDKETIIILDAYANGVFSTDSESIVKDKILQWISYLQAQPSYQEEQLKYWRIALIESGTNNVKFSDFEYLSKYCPTWEEWAFILSTARCHEAIYNHFKRALEKPIQPMDLVKRLDKVLEQLVSNYDKEELSLRKAEAYESLIIKHKGNEDAANKEMEIEAINLAPTRDLASILSEIALKPELTQSSPAAQKLAIALSKDYILTAYSQVVNKCRKHIPTSIPLQIDGFSATTQDGSNELEVIAEFNAYLNKLMEKDLEPIALSLLDKFSVIGGGTLILICLVMIVTGSYLMGFTVAILGIYMIIAFLSKNKSVNSARNKVVSDYELRSEKGSIIIQNFMAEVVDYFDEFYTRDKEVNKVQELLELVTPEQYIQKNADLKSRAVKL